MMLGMGTRMGIRIMQGGCRWTMRRSLSTDLNAALQPFYAAVHPKYMGKRHSLAQQINEKSLKLLSSHLESLSEHKSSQLPNKGQLSFYMRSEADEAYNLIQIQVDEQILDPHELVQNILRRCQLTETNATEKTSNMKGIEMALNHNSWMTKTAAARACSQSGNDLKTEIARLEKTLVQTLGILGTRYDCGCNMERYCDCLKQLEQLAQACGPQLAMLCQRIVVFGPYTGISLDGHVMLFTGDPVTSWYSFIKKITLHEIYHKLVPLYEQALSTVLLGIQIKRHNFMPLASEAKTYANGLLRVISSINESCESRPLMQKLPISCLNDFHLAIVPISGGEQPKITSTGLFLAPASCSGSVLIDFICSNLELAKRRYSHYESDMVEERQLVEQCKKLLRLDNLTKDDSVTPDKMVCTLRHLLKGPIQNHSQIEPNAKSYENISIHVTNYYSVLTDGIICIPWDFMHRKVVSKIQ